MLIIDLVSKIYFARLLVNIFAMFDSSLTELAHCMLLSRPVMLNIFVF